MASPLHCLPLLPVIPAILLFLFGGVPCSALKAALAEGFGDAISSVVSNPALSLSLPSPLSVGEALLTEKTVRGVFCALSTYGVRLTDGGGRSSEWAEMYSG
mmetsp:Transcript_43034/g.103740  ORF Transcript_43034/g.103740 Transcript_43034/m.103740 type:complete len:102 (-) Transcript_43034:104-409(-)